MNFPLSRTVLALAALGALAACGPTQDASEKGLTVLHVPMRTDGPNSLDPVQGSTTYDNVACSQIFQTLLQYAYLKEPLELEPLLLAEMPKTEDEGKSYSFRLKKGVRFHDNACWPDGKGRELVAGDVFYSWKRMADNRNKVNGWWLYENTIVGFDDYKNEQNAAVLAGEEFDYDAEVAGMRIIDDYAFEVELVEPVQRFPWVLAMFQTAVVPREAVEHYGETLPRNPVGTGPFMMEEWVQGKSLSLVRNPNYHEDLYPSEFTPSYVDESYVEDAGKQLPLADRVEITMFVESQPRWLAFQSGKIDYIQVPSENYEEAYNKRTGELRPDYRDRGIVNHDVQLLDFIFRAFNMDDELLGGYDDKRRALRQAIAYAIDVEEINRTFYNDTPILYDGMIPPGMDGFPENGNGPISYRRLELDKARQKLVEAGYPGGEGLPPIQLWTSRGENSPEQVELIQRQLGEAGIRVEARLVDFSQLMEALDSKQAQMFSYAWGSDYPDAENNLALFYGPNESPGNNSFNYKSDEFDRMYEELRLMPVGPRRAELIRTMRDMVMADCVFAGSQARVRNYLAHPWLVNFKPNEVFYNWLKYVDVDESKRVQG